MGRIPASASYTGQYNALIHSFKKRLSIEIKFLDIEDSIMMRIKSLLSIIIVDILSFYYVRTNTHRHTYIHTYIRVYTPSTILNVLLTSLCLLLFHTLQEAGAINHHLTDDEIEKQKS